MRNRFRAALVGASAAAALALALPTTATAGEFDGVTVNILTITGPTISGPMQRRAPEFKELTGAEINVITVPFADIYPKLTADWASGTNSIDAAVFAPQWAVDFITPGYLLDLTDWSEADADLQADDIAPFFNEISQRFAGRTYLITVDGDFQMVYYRSDVADKLGLSEPETWDDYVAFAKAAHGMDLNDDGEPDFGSCIAKKRNAQSYWMISSIASGYLQAKGTAEGAFFDPRDMKPLFNNDAFAAALEIYAATTEFGPPDELNLDVGDTRGLFTSGRCALTLDWGDIGTLAIDPVNSKVIDKVGAIMLPGSRSVLDRDTGELVACDEERCPHAINGVNRAPFAAFGGWSGAINVAADEMVQRAAYEYFSYLSQPAQSNVDVTIGATGFNPYRISQFENLGPWLEAGMSEAAAESYLGAIKASLNSPNMALDLRIPQNHAYQGVALDTALSRFAAGEIDAATMMATVEEAWNELNEDNGVEEQLEAYRGSIGAN